jgi:hypothetical protein
LKGVAVRIRLRIRSRTTGRELRAVALVNSGFETVKPQLLVPIKVAELLGLWPQIPRDYIVKDYMTAGGPARMHVLVDEVEVSVDVEHSTNPVISDLVISPFEEEILISDKLAGKLGIVVYDFAEGIWRLQTDPEAVRRRSEERETWS